MAFEPIRPVLYRRVAARNLVALPGSAKRAG